MIQEHINPGREAGQPVGVYVVTQESLNRPGENEGPGGTRDTKLVPKEKSKDMEYFNTCNFTL